MAHPGRRQSAARPRIGAPGARLRGPNRQLRCGRLLAAALLAACAPGAGPAGPPPAGAPGTAALASPVATDLAPLGEAIRARIAREAEGEVSVAIVDLEGGRYLGIDDRVEMHAASTMKLPVLLELYRSAALRGLSLDAPVPVRNEFRSIADGSRYSLAVEDDSDREIYAHVGATLPLRDLAHRMIARSSNLASNLLLERVGADSVNAMLATIDAGGMHVLRGVQDIPAFERGLSNTTTAEGFARALAALAHCSVLPRDWCADAHRILEAQEFRDMIPAGLPAGTRVANKSGWITGIRHDGAIIQPRTGLPYVLVVMTRGLPDTLTAQRAAADISRLAWQALGDEGTLRPRHLRNPDVAPLLALHERVRVGGIGTYTLRHAQLWGALEPIVRAAPAIREEEVGRSLEGRPIRLLRFGDGATRVLLWSQMHGDETTASRALADLLHYIATADPADARVRVWRENLTLLVVPMLNPDGAERHQRRNAVGIDVNRDARVLATPEGRTLKAVRDRFEPHYGFNLHDQNPRTRVGTADRRAAISLLAPPPDADRTETPGVLRAKRLASFIGAAAEPLVGGHITRYDESFNPRAFGDLTQAWGTSAVLIESGGWAGEHTKHYLRRVNFVMLVRALDALATGAHERTDPRWYAAIPPNGRALNDVLIRGIAIVLPGRAPVRADIAIDEDAPGRGWRIVEVGDLEGTAARETIGGDGLFLHVEADHAAGDAILAAPAPAPDFTIRRGPRPNAEVVWRYREGVLRQH